MNQGSIETRSSAASAVELLGVRAPASDFSYRSQRSNDRFDSIFDSLQQRTGNGAQSSGLDREVFGNLTVGAQNEQKQAPVQQSAREEVEEPLEEKEHINSTSKDESATAGNQKVDENDPDTEQVASKEENKEPIANGNSTGESEEKSGAQVAEVTDKPGSQTGKTRNTGTNGEEKRAVKLTEEGKVSSSKSFQLQTQKVTVVKDADAEKSAKTTVLHNTGKKSVAEGSDKPAIDVKQSVNATGTDTPTVAKAAPQAKVSGSPEVPEDSAKGLVKAAKLAAKTTKSATQELKSAPEQESDTKTAVQKSANRSAKTSTVPHESLRAAETAILKNPLKTDGLQAQGRLAQFDQEIGIKTAEQAVNKQSKMVSEVKNSESAGSEKGFLKEANPNGSVNRAQAVTSRSDTGGFSSNSHFGGQHGQSDGHGGSRGSEQFRHWVEGNSEVRSVAQSAQQGEFVDRAVGSALSARVVNQIMNHIDRLRDSEKSRVKVSLGAEASGVTVDIRIEGDAIYTSFQGDPEILNQLKEEWDDIKDRATRRGVSLNDPEFIEISYSSSSESESFLPDDGIAKEGKSQSVIQHKNNQPVRPGEMTAAAGSSGPVHSFYA